MLDRKTLNDFISKANHAYQQFCVWVYSNNLFVKHEVDFNNVPMGEDCKYKNFWVVMIVSLQHSWIFSIARLLDPPYFIRDKNKTDPRLSIDYILELVDDDYLEKIIKTALDNHKTFIHSIREHRKNFLAHNSVHFKNKKVEAGVESFFKALDDIIAEIKDKKPHLKDCNSINLEHTEKLSKDGVEEIFQALSNRGGILEK